MAYSIITLDDVKAELGVSVDTMDLDKDALIEDIIDSISTLFESICGRYFISREHTTYISGDGEDYIYLPNRPITSVSGVWVDFYRDFEDDDLVDTDDYYISNESDCIILAPSSEQYNFPRARENVKIIYTAGYARASIPYDLKRACIKEVVREYKTKDDSFVTSKTNVDTSSTRYDGELLPYTRLVLSKYTNVIVE